MKNEKTIIGLMWVLAVLPLVLTFVIFGKLPDQVPMHWNIHGEIDSWYPKFPGAFILPVFAIAITALISVLPKIDPKKENYERFRSQYLIIRLVLVVFFVIMQLIVIGVSMGATFIGVDTIVKLLVGLLFIVLGNFMPKIKHNYFMGIRTPWTIANETVWTKSHRHGGFMWFAAGIVMSVLAFIKGPVSAALYFAVIMITTLETTIYSWIQYKKVTK
jgi:uncharacterized membrane protein